MEVTCAGPIDPDTGFIKDFWDIDAIVMPIVESIDHRLLNDIPGLGNPTAEFISRWFLLRLSEHGVSAVRIYETKDCWADSNFDTNSDIEVRIPPEQSDIT